MSRERGVLYGAERCGEGKRGVVEGFITGVYNLVALGVVNSYAIYQVLLSNERQFVLEG